MRKLALSITILLGIAQSCLYANQGQSDNPFDQKVYLPGDFFEYFFKGRGPVPTFKTYHELYQLYDRKSDGGYMAFDTWRTKFTRQMEDRMDYCVNNMHNTTFIKEHAQDCKKVASNLLIIRPYSSFLEPNIYQSIRKYKRTLEELEKKSKEKILYN